MDHKLLLAFLPEFQAYRDGLKAKAEATEDEMHVAMTVDVLISYLRQEYRTTVATIENLTSHGEVTFDLLYAILVPRAIMVTTNPVTKELQALQLALANRITIGSGKPAYELILEGIDVDDTASRIKAFARTQTRMLVTPFKGTVNITALDAYPIQYHPLEAELRETLLARGKKWIGLAHGIRHLDYNGIGAQRRADGKIVKWSVSLLY